MRHSEPARILVRFYPGLLLAALLLVCGQSFAEDPAGTPADQLLVDPRIQELRLALQSATREHGPVAPQLIPILNELATAELAAGEKEYAAVRLERVVELRRASDGFYSQSLTTPLLQLANIYMGAGLFERAISKLRYAQHLTHRRDGVYSLEQVALIENLARAFLGNDEADEARREMRLAFDLSHRVHGKEAVEHVPGMLRYAAWFRFTGEDRKARHLYKNAIALLESVHGADHHSLIAPLTSLSATASLPGYYRRERESALLRADDILNQQPGVDPEDRAVSALRLGDFFTNLKAPDKARTHYQRAWEIIGSIDEARIDREKVFSQPVALNFPHSILPDTRRDVIFQQPVITVTWDIDIDASGKVSRVAVVEHSGPTLITRTLRKAAFTLRFRPEIRNGKPVATRNFRITESVRLESARSRALFEEQLAKQIETVWRKVRVRAKGRKIPAPSSSPRGTG